MFFVLTLFAVISPVFSQEDLEYYIKRFRYQALEMPARREALYRLGEKLFYDKKLSGKNNISCQSCHSLEGFSGDGIPLSIGEGGEGVGIRRIQRKGLVLLRHTPAIYNMGHPSFRVFFWDGRVASRPFENAWITPEPKLNGTNPELKEIAKTFENTLAVQTVFPLTSPEEMLGKESKLTRVEAWDLVMKKVTENPEYQKLLKNAFPGARAFNIAHVGNALSELIRHHFSAVNTPWDQYLRGRKEALSPRMKRGAVLFHSRANCIFCHNGNHFTNQSIENIGVPQIGPDDQGLRDYRFKVPPLRNVGVTAPYMHSGVFKTLREVVDHYSQPVQSLRNFQWNPRHPNYTTPLPLDKDPVRNNNREERLSRMLARVLTLNDEEKDDLICFLAVALTDVSLHAVLSKKGVVNEIDDCSPRTY